jgi:hypothetical protein
LDHSGFTLVLSNNHWSNLHTCQQFVKWIWFVIFNQNENDWIYPNDQKKVWFINCWSVHQSSEF